MCLCQFVIGCCICHCCGGFYLWGLSGVLPNVEVVEVGSEPFRPIFGVVCGVVVVNESRQDEKMGWCGFIREALLYLVRTVVYNYRFCSTDIFFLLLPLPRISDSEAV